MRRIFALAMVALMAITFAVAAVSCGKKEEATMETTPPVETMPDTSMMSDTMAADTSMQH